VIETPEKLRLTGCVCAENQIALARFSGSEHSPKHSPQLIHVNDEWKLYEQYSMLPTCSRCVAYKRC